MNIFKTSTMDPVTFNTTMGPVTMDPVTFNTTTASTVESAQEYNARTFYIRIPAIVFLSVLMPLGILGNASVIYIYGFCLKRSNVQFFIIILASFDIVSSLVGVPLELCELRHMHVYTSGGLCKVQRLVNYSGSIGSALVLLSISVERYAKVCRPTHSQMTPRHAKAIALFILIVSVPLAIPIAISYDRLPVQVEGNITVYQCAFHYSPLVFAYYSSFLPVMVANFITMFVLYTCVVRSARRHFRQLEDRHTASNNTNKGHDKSRRKISRTSMSVICLTVVYACSFTPTLVIGLATRFYANVHLSPAKEGALILFYRSWAINCSINPIVYGFFNKGYRDTFRELTTAILCLRLPKTRKRSKDFATTSAIDTNL